MVVREDHEAYNAVLLEGHEFPPCLRTRAVLFPRESIVAVFSYMTQFPGTCHWQQFLCVVSFQEHDGLRILTTFEGMDVDIAKFVKGCMRLPEDDGPTDADDEQASDASTTEPASEGECSNEASHQTDEELEARATSKPTGCNGVDEGSHLDESDTGGIPFSEELDDTDEQCPLQSSRGGGFSLMSSTPVTSFHDPPHSHAWGFEDGQEVEDIIEPAHEDAAIAEGHQDAAQAHADVVLTEIQDQEARWIAITYGLGLLRGCGFRQLHEVWQCHVGSILMRAATRILLWIYIVGGSI